MEEVKTKDEGDNCSMKDCTGTYEYKYDGDGCSCHVNPPCSYCTSSYLECNVCGTTLDEANNLNALHV